MSLFDKDNLIHYKNSLQNIFKDKEDLVVKAVEINKHV